MRRADRHRRHDFSRRSLLVLGLNGGLLAVVAGRLYRLQIVEHERYAAQSDENRVQLRLLPPVRGRILDRRGVVVAGRRWHHYLHVELPGDPEDRVAAERQLERILQPAGTRYADLGQLFRSPTADAAGGGRPVRLESWEDVTKVAARSVLLPGVSVRRESERHYPGGEALAHLLGYVSPVTREDVDRQAVLAHLSNYQIGRIGLERTQETVLRGKVGTLHVEVNAHNQPVRNLLEKKAVPGADLQLTVDSRLQRRAAARLAGQSGAAIVLDAVGGEALACCSWPSFDPNRFVSGLDRTTWEALSNHPSTPLFDRAVRGHYAPGSTFKLVVALAALEAGHDPATTVLCGGAREIGGNRFHCWRRAGHGRLGLHEAIAQSCDLHFYELALRFGIGRIAAMARHLGLGGPAVADRAVREWTGLVPTRAWKEETYGRAWYPSDTANVGIGQGYLLATPVQLALMTARIASGRQLGVRFIRRATGSGTDGNPVREGAPPDGADGRSAAPLALRDTSLDAVRAAMSAVVNGRRGTARGSRIRQPDFRMAGKTGTVQVRRITAAERKSGVRRNEDLPREFRDHALFVGYAPAEQPRYVVAVVVEHGGSGSRVAAPVARDLLLEAHRLDLMGTVPGPGQVA